MPHLHERGAEELESLVMQDLLDSVPLILHQEMVEERRIDAAESPASARRRTATGKTVEMSGLQFAEG